MILRINLIISVFILLQFSLCENKKIIKEIFLFPHTYEGPVLVVFNNCKYGKASENQVIYNIPNSGILSTENQKIPYGEKLNHRYFFVDKKGNKIEELEMYISDDFNENQCYIMNGKYGNYTKYIDSKKYSIEYRIFLVGKIINRSKLQKQADSLLANLDFQNLDRPDCPDSVSLSKDKKHN